MNVVVTGGGTIAAIDDVRVIANLSTGRLSARITEACLERGAAVWHIHAPHAALPYRRAAVFDLDTNDEAAELARLRRLRQRYRQARGRLRLLPLEQGTVEEYAACLRQVFEAQPIDLAFLAMAVSDFRPEPVAGKIESNGELVLRCRATPKIIQSVRDWAPEVYLVGFKLLSGVSTERLIAEARTACTVNRADLTVANDLRTVQAGQHQIHLVRPEQPVETFGPDGDIAEELVERAFAWAAAALARREPIPPEGGA